MNALSLLWGGRQLDRYTYAAGIAVLQLYTAMHHVNQAPSNNNPEFIYASLLRSGSVGRIQHRLKILDRLATIINSYLDPRRLNISI